MNKLASITRSIPRNVITQHLSKTRQFNTKKSKFNSNEKYDDALFYTVIGLSVLSVSTSLYAIYLGTHHP